MPVEFARQFYLEDATTFEHAGGSWMRSAPELLERLVHLQRLELIIAKKENYRIALQGASG